MLPPKTTDIKPLYARALDLQKQGKGAEALAIHQRILLAQPKLAEVHFQIGRIHAEAGHTDKAEAALRKALALKPGEAAIWQALAAVLRGGAAKKLAREAAKAGIVLGTEAEAAPILAGLARDPAKAEAAALALVKQAPQAFWPVFVLGQARLARGNWAGALGALEAAHARDPHHAEAALALGQCLARLDQPSRAEALLRPLAGSSSRARLALARLLREGLRFDEAVAVLGDDAASAALAAELALAEAARGHVDAALEAATRAISAGADPVALSLDLARGLQGAGAAAAMPRALELGLAQFPGDPRLLTQLAAHLQSDGAFDRAAAILDDVIAAHPGHAPAYLSQVSSRKLSEGDPLLDQLLTQAGRADLPVADRRILNFAAAKAMEGLKRREAVIDHVHRANRLMASEFGYSFEADLAAARALVADWPVLQSIAPEAPSDPVFFVTGLPRSGTTLVETILAAHSGVAAGGEMPFLNRALAPALEGLRAGVPDPGAFAAAGARYLAAGRRRAGGTLFTDKAISTFSRVGHAATALPGARFVILDRDPRDVGWSIYRNMFAPGSHRYATDLATIGRYIRLHDALVAFWADALPDRVMRISYEALTAEPEPVIRDLVAFAGLDWEDACLAPEKSGRRVETLSFAQVRQPIGRQAVAGWRAYETDLAPLIAALETEIDLFA